MKRLGAVAALSFALAACGQASPSAKGAGVAPSAASTSIASPAATKADPSPSSDPPPAATRDASNDIQLERHVVKDPQINDIDAYSVLVPAGWTFTGKVEWRHELANLAASILTVEDPASGAAIETFWPVQYDYADPLLMPVGSNWLGAIVKAPLSAKEYVTKVVLPTYRPGAKVVSVDDLPKVADAWRAVEPKLSGDTMKVGSVLVRIRTERDSTAYDEDFYVTVVSHSINGIVQWGPRNLYAFRAPAGALDDATPLLESIASSGQVTPLWSANYQIVYALFVNGQYAAIRAAGELSRHLAQNADEINDSLMAGYEAQQAAEDRIYDSFSDYIRDVDRYDVPDVGRVTLPNSYSVCGAGAGTVVLIPLLGGCPDDTTLIKPAQ